MCHPLLNVDERQTVVQQLHSLRVPKSMGFEGKDGTVFVMDLMGLQEIFQMFTKGAVAERAACAFVTQGCSCTVSCRKQIPLWVVLVRKFAGNEFFLCLNHRCNLICDRNAMPEHSGFVDIAAEKPTTLISLQASIMPERKNIRDPPSRSSEQKDHWNIFWPQEMKLFVKLI